MHMTTHMTKNVTRATALAAAMMAVLGLAATLSAQTAKAETPSLTGTWNMGLQGGHVIPVALVLKQEGTTLTGTIAMPTQNVGQTEEVVLTGEASNGALTLTGTVEHAKEPTRLEITGKMNDEGIIEGKLAMPGHDLSYTAERLRERK
jgi:hypothetical protein